MAAQTTTIVLPSLYPLVAAGFKALLKRLHPPFLAPRRQRRCLSRQRTSYPMLPRQRRQKQQRQKEQPRAQQAPRLSSNLLCSLWC